MIVNLRGTSGSGKTYLARRVMEYLPLQSKVFIPERKRPIGYDCRGSVVDMQAGEAPVFVVGSYENTCGGCDTVPSLDLVFETVRKAHERGRHVVFEGLLVSAEVRRTAQLHLDGLPLVVIGLTEVPLAECLASVAARRAAKGNTEPLDPTNTESKWKGTRSACDRLEKAGVTVFRCDRTQALQVLEETLGLA